MERLRIVKFYSLAPPRAQKLTGDNFKVV